jgi:hypothetical protein
MIVRDSFTITEVFIPIGTTAEELDAILKEAQNDNTRPIHADVAGIRERESCYPNVL